MNPDPDRPDSAAQPARQLGRLQEQIGEARVVLAGLRQEAQDAREQLRHGQPPALVKANEELVLAILRNQVAAETAARSAQDESHLARLDALAAHEHRHAQQMEANEQLILAALGAQELQAAAERAQRRQTELLALVVHELRNPLGPISNAAALLGKIATNEPTLVRVQGIIERQVAHMVRLVSDLLDVSRVSTGKLRIEWQQVEMKDVICDTVEAGRMLMDARRQRFAVQLPERALIVMGDVVRLTQVLSNVLDNASKYTPEGGEIGLSAMVLDGAVVITVADNGIGITAEALPHVFDPFVQDLHATVFNGKGLGIGLTVVRELVEAHGGSVAAHSSGTALGSQFVVTIPLMLERLDH